MSGEEIITWDVREDSKKLSDEEFFKKHLRTKEGFLPSIPTALQQEKNDIIDNEEDLTQSSSFVDFLIAKATTGPISDRIRIEFINPALASFGEPDPEFQIYESDIVGYEEYAHFLFQAENKAQLDAYKNNIDRLRVDKKIIAEHGLFANFAGEFVSPESWLGFGLAGKTFGFVQSGLKYLKYGKKAAQIANTLTKHKLGEGFWSSYAQKVGGLAIKNAGFGATLGGIQVGIEEAMGADVSGQEMLNQITTASLLGAGFGVTFGTAGDFVLKAKAKNAAEKYKKLIQDPKNLSIENVTISIDPKKINESGYLYGSVKDAFGQALPITPGIRTSTSPSLVTREISRRMVDNFITFVDEEGNILTNNAATVESIANKESAIYGTRITNELNKGFKEWVSQSGKIHIKEKLKVDVWGGSKQWDEFNGLVAEAARNGDVHSNPVIERTAKALRPITDEITNKGLESGLFDLKLKDLEEIDASIKKIQRLQKKAEKEGSDISNLKKEQESLLLKRKEIENKVYTVKDFKRVGDESYLPRAYDKNKIASNPKGFQDAIRQGMISKLKTKGLFEKQNLTNNEKKILEKINKQLDESVKSVWNEIMHNFEGRIVSRNYSTRGAENARVLDFDTKYVQDFVINHYADTIYRFIQTIIPDTHMMKAFGTLEIEALQKSIIKDYDALIDAASKKGNRLEAERLQNYRDNDLEDIEAMFNRVRGTSVLDPWNFTAGGRLINNSMATIKNLNVARMLGGIILAGLNDLGQIQILLGFKRFFGSALKIIGSLRFSKKELIDLDPIFNATTLWKQTRQANFGEMIGGSGFLAWTAKTSRGFANTTSYLSGIHAFDKTCKFIVGYTTSERMIKAGELLSKGQKLAEKEAKALKTLGVSDDQLKAIYNQFQKHGTKKGGVFAPGTTKWTDSNAKDVFSAAIMKMQNQAVLTPGAGTVPVMFDHPTMKVFTQFRRFTFSAFEKCMIPALQNVGYYTFTGATLMMCIGVLRAKIRSLVGGYELTDDQILDQALKECDFMSYYGDVYGLAKSILGFDEEVNKANADFINSVQGTVLGFVKDSTYAGGAALKILRGDSLSKGEIHALRKMIPSQNNPIFSSLFNKAEDYLQERYGKKIR